MGPTGTMSILALLTQEGFEMHFRRPKLIFLYTPVKKITLKYLVIFYSILNYEDWTISWG